MASSIPPVRDKSLPQVRGRYMHVFSAHIQRLPEADRGQIRTAVPELDWSEIDAAGMFSWLAFERNLHCTRAVSQVLGAKRTNEFFVSLLLTTFKTPLLQSLVDPVVRRFGKDPGIVLQWVPKAWLLMFKNVGAWRVIDREIGALSLVLEGLPAVAAADRLWLQSLASSMGAVFALAELEGAATIREHDVAKGSVVYRARWERR